MATAEAGVRKKVPKGSKAVETKKRGRPKASGSSIEWSDPKEVLLADIVFDETYQSRADIPSSAEYRELIESSDGKWPFSEPVKLVEIKGKLVLIAGFTRCAAANAAGAEKVLAVIAKATKDKAFELSLGENESHGYRRTNADKAKAVRLALGKWPGKSANAIAGICKVSHTYVSNVMAKLKDVEQVSTSELEPAPPSAKDLPKAAATKLAGTPEESVKSPEESPADDDPFEIPDYVEADATPTAKAESIKSSGVNLTAEKRTEARAVVGKLVRLLSELGIADSCSGNVESILKAIG